MATNKPAKDATASQRLVWVFQQITGIDKRDVTAGTQHYKAFGIDDIYAKLHDILAEAGLYVMPRVKKADYVDRVVTKSGSRGEYEATTVDARLIMEYRFTAPDGSHDTMIVPCEARDNYDKATNQAIQQGYKYGLVQGFMIPTGEKDPDTAAVEAPAGPDPRRWTNEAWHYIAEMFPDDTETVWWDLRSQLDIARKTELDEDMCVALKAKADTVAKGK